MKNNCHFLSQSIAEFLGTFFLIFFGCGAMILHQINPTLIDGFAIPLVFGGTVSIMIYAVGHISGAHFNPAVTIAFFITKKLPSQRVLPYIFAQISGGVCASFLHQLIWSNQNHDFGMTHLTIGLPQAFLLEIILTFVLMFVIISVATDSRAVGELAGLAIGTTVTLCSFVWGPLTGASMNPARSLAPALLSGHYENLWIYIFAPIVGAILGAITYEKIKCDADSKDNPGCC